ncbi:hypothetical protein L873DRAFT_615463 [Choiromyces venosus 120613-1]|uniref:Uncharacterized protein n=1 Tax=Choiromyces venosus 120613-1 TaxID=1336337 RepID=A0A3N4IV66_9PEZI|nr:hypothetical protein L873DRAFT_615463 [Choiromyces venosus 120613-1]
MSASYVIMFRSSRVAFTSLRGGPVWSSWPRFFTFSLLCWGWAAFYAGFAPPCRVGGSYSGSVAPGCVTPIGISSGDPEYCRVCAGCVASRGCRRLLRRWLSWRFRWCRSRHLILLWMSPVPPWLLLICLPSADDNAAMAGTESVGGGSVAASRPVGVAAVGQPTFKPMVVLRVYDFLRGGVKKLVFWIARAMGVGRVSLVTAIWSDVSRENRIILAPRLLVEGWRFRDLLSCDCRGLVEELGEFFLVFCCGGWFAGRCSGCFGFFCFAHICDTLKLYVWCDAVILVNIDD